MAFGSGTVLGGGQNRSLLPERLRKKTEKPGAPRVPTAARKRRSLLQGIAPREKPGDRRAGPLLKGIGPDETLREFFRRSRRERGMMHRGR